jgi:hypothetical protein
MFRRRVAAGESKGSDSARHRQQARKRLDIAADRRLEFVSLPRRRLLARRLAKREGREKEGRALMVNLPGHQEVQRRLQASAAQRSQNAERKKQRKNHHRQGHNNSGAIIVAAPERKSFRSRFFATLGTPRCGIRL